MHKIDLLKTTCFGGKYPAFSSCEIPNNAKNHKITKNGHLEENNKAKPFIIFSFIEKQHM